MQTEAVVALIISSLALLSAIVTAVISARKNDLDILRGIISELRDQMWSMDCRNRDLEDWAERLVAQVRQANLIPEKLIKHEYKRNDDA